MREEVVEQFEYPLGDRMLMLHLAKVFPNFRGSNLGLVAAHRIIQQFGNRLVVAKAQPLQHHNGFNDEGAMKYDAFEPDRAAALKRLTRHWQRLGFKPIADSGFLGLNTAFKLPVPKLRKAPTKGSPRSSNKRKNS